MTKNSNRGGGGGVRGCCLNALWNLHSFLFVNWFLEILHQLLPRFAITFQNFVWNWCDCFVNFRKRNGANLTGHNWPSWRLSTCWMTLLTKVILMWDLCVCVCVRACVHVLSCACVRGWWHMCRNAWTASRHVLCIVEWKRGCSQTTLAEKKRIVKEQIFFAMLIKFSYQRICFVLIAVLFYLFFLSTRLISRIQSTLSRRQRE